MIETNIQIENEIIQQIVTALGQVPDSAMDGIRQATETMRRLSLGRTPIGVSPTSPHLKREWSNVEYQTGGFSFGNPVDYSDTIEQGLYHRPGPRTVEQDGRVYSRQAPGGIIAPLMADEQTLQGVVNVVLQAIIRGLERVRT